jgi:hypothetical protein
VMRTCAMLAALSAMMAFLFIKNMKAAEWCPTLGRV